MSYDFPFTLRDVAELCGIPTSTTKDNEYVTCPFCGKKKKMNLKYSTGQYNCPACGTGGHMLSLYAKLNGMEYAKNSEIASAIKERFGIDNSTYFAPKSTSTYSSDVKVNNDIDFESMKHKDSVFRAFLDKLSLAQMHKDKLLNRGFNLKDIDKWLFKSVPLFGYKGICERLISEGYNLEGVPGFYLDANRWTANINSNTTGIIVPAHNIFGYIDSLQIRLDRPFGKQKYIWISSDDEPHGTKASATAFFAKGCRRNDTLVITEGAFKALISSKVFGYSVLGIAGVNNQKDIIRIIPKIKRMGYTKIVEAFDADFCTNDNVKKAKDSLKELMIENGFAYESYEWDISKGKGLDDYALYILNNTQHI